MRLCTFVSWPPDLNSLGIAKTLVQGVLAGRVLAGHNGWQCILLPALPSLFAVGL